MNKNDLESVVKVYCQIYHYRLNKENTEEKIQLNKLCRLIDSTV